MGNTVDAFTESERFVFTVTFVERDSAPGDIAGLCERLVGFLRDLAVCPEWINSLHMAVEELLTNLAKYGKSEESENNHLWAKGVIAVADGTASLTLEDNSIPFDPGGGAAADDDFPDLLDRPVGGLGLFMLMRMFDSMHYQRQPGKNVSSWILGSDQSKDDK